MKLHLLFNCTFFLNKKNYNSILLKWIFFNKSCVVFLDVFAFNYFFWLRFLCFINNISVFFFDSVSLLNLFFFCEFSYLKNGIFLLSNNSYLSMIKCLNMLYKKFIKYLVVGFCYNRYFWNIDLLDFIYFENIYYFYCNNLLIFFYFFYYAFFIFFYVFLCALYNIYSFLVFLISNTTLTSNRVIF